MVAVTTKWHPKPFLHSVRQIPTPCRLEEIMSVIEEPKLQSREFNQFRKMIFDLAGISLADTKVVMVQGRLAKRLRSLELPSYRDYLDYLLEDKEGTEKTKFINALTTNKTEFFRESHHFDYLTNTVFPELVKQSEVNGTKKLRIWCSASSTGEEPYTIAMTVSEFFHLRKGWDIRILASDIDTDVLHAASEGVYDASRMEDIPPHLRKKYFTRTQRTDDGPWKANPSIRDLITFRQINLLQPNWPIHTDFQVIFCRNVMIYFDPPSQSKLVDQFAEKLTPNGYLIIGHSESLLGLTENYKSLGDTVYRCIAGSRPKSHRTPMPSPASDRPKSAPVVIRSGDATSSTPIGMGRETDTESKYTLHGEPVRRIIVGEVEASEKPMWISTLLGSCVSVCLYDERAKIGGMNHFMLPDSHVQKDCYASYGVHAMELLINAIMGLGGDRRRLKAKLFGGCVVGKASSQSLHIGRKNINFATEFMANESIPVVSSHVGGNFGMRIDFHTHTAKVLLRSLDPEITLQLDRRERQQAMSIVREASQHFDFTLFE